MNAEIENLPPSRELLEFYQKRIKESESEKEEILSLLERYKNLSALPHAEKEREKLVNDLSELKTALSDVNVFIHAEREQVANLRLEKKQLEVEQKFLKQKIAFLLHVCDMSEEQLNAYLRSNRNKNVLHKAFMGRRKETQLTLQRLKDSEPSEKEIFLESKVKTLEEQLRTARESWEEEKNTLLEERLLQKAEMKAEREQDQAHINLISLKLEEAKKLAFDATKKTAETKSEVQKCKNVWLAEKEKLLMDLETFRGVCPSSISVQSLRRSGSFENVDSLRSACEMKRLRKELSSTKRELKEADDMKCLYESRYMKIEGEFARLREQREAEQAIYKERIRKMAESKDLLRKQKEQSEKRRRLQMEGFFSELKLVRNDLRKIVYQFFKLTKLYSESQELPNMAEVQDLKLASALARSVHRAIINAKRNMISVESKHSKER